MTTHTRPRGLTDIEAGKLIADVQHIKDGQERQEKTMEQILKKMDNYITRADFDSYKSERQKQADERYVLQKDIQGLVSLWGFVGSTFGKMVATALVGALVALTYQMITSTVFIKEFKQHQSMQRAKEE